MRIKLRVHLIVAVILVWALVAGIAAATESINRLCQVSFEKESMPKSEVALFCECVAADVEPRLSSDQRSLVRTIAAGLQPGSSGVSRNHLDQVATSGIRDMIVAAQARCSDALYSNSDYIQLKSDDGAQLGFYCDSDRVVPVASFRKDNLRFASEAEIEKSIEAMIMGTDDSGNYPVVEVTWQVNGGESTTEYWDVNLAGDGADATVAGKLLRDVRFSDQFTFSAKRGSAEYSGRFKVSKKIPLNWQPCSVR